MTVFATTVQARMGSSRLPGKVLEQVAGKPMLELMVERLKRVPSGGPVIICTTDNVADDAICALGERLDVGVWRGSEVDVLGRVLGASRAYGVDVVVETTGDCPLIDPDVVERVVSSYRASNVDYASNILARTYPIGMDTQVFATEVLADVARRTDDATDHEHVSLFIYNHPELYSLKNFPAPPELAWPDLRLTLDTPEDLALIRAIFDRLYPNDPAFTLGDIVRLLRARPELVNLNAQVRHRWVRQSA